MFISQGIVVDVPFAIFFLRHLIKQPHNLLYSSLDELYSMDPELSKSLHFIKVSYCVNCLHMDLYVSGVLSMCGVCRYLWCRSLCACDVLGSLWCLRSL